MPGSTSFALLAGIIVLQWHSTGDQQQFHLFTGKVLTAVTGRNVWPHKDFRCEPVLAIIEPGFKLLCQVQSPTPAPCSVAAHVASRRGNGAAERGAKRCWARSALQGCHAYTQENRDCFTQPQVPSIVRARQVVAW